MNTRLVDAAAARQDDDEAWGFRTRKVHTEGQLTAGVIWPWTGVAVDGAVPGPHGRRVVVP